VEIDDADLTAPASMSPSKRHGRYPQRQARRTSAQRRILRRGEVSLITFKSSHFERPPTAGSRDREPHDPRGDEAGHPDRRLDAPPSKALSGNTVRGASATGSCSARTSAGLEQDLGTGGVAVGDEVEFDIDVEFVEETKAAAN